MKTLSIVIPALNERDGIEKTIEAVPVEELAGMGYQTQVLVVDNGSNDGTGELARQAGAEVILEPRRGYGSAYKTGFAHAKGDIIATADADATYPVEDIPRLVQILEKEEVEFLTTNRFALMDRDAMSQRNKIGNKILTLIIRVLFRLNLKDSQSGMWVFRRGILDRLMLKANNLLSQEIKIEACHYARCRWKEVPIRYRARLGGEVKGGTWIVGIMDVFHLIGKRLIR